jgi:hypothetical protein
VEPDLIMKNLEPFYQGSIQRSLVYKINALDANGKFNPKSEITRAEAAVMVYNALEYLNAGHIPVK